MTSPDLEITPEPSSEERAAIEAAVAKALAEETPARGPWWQAGVVDATDEEAD